MGLHPAAVAATDRRARRGRSLLERVAIRIPGAVQWMARIVFALPPSRVRTALIDYGYRRGYAAYNRGDWEFNTALFDPHGYVVDSPDLAQVGPDIPGRAGGVAGYMERQRLLDGAFSDIRIDYRGCLEIDRTRTAALVHLIGVGRGSGARVDHPFLDVHEMRRGKLIHQVTWWDREEGLRALGISPQSDGATPG
jgi:ketosteroid isomerase-like protein